MKKHSIIISLILLLCLSVMVFVLSGCSYYNEDNTYNNAPISFNVNQDQKFTIMQVTDMHFQSTVSGSNKSIKMISKAIEKNQPNLVIATGDIATPSKHNPSGALKGLKKFAHMMDEMETPWAMVYGNHDIENSKYLDDAVFRETLSRYKQPMIAKTDHGLTDYTIDIKDTNGKKVLHTLVMMDTHGKDLETNSYLPISKEQVNWYEKEILNRKKDNNNVTVPSSFFAHMPLPAFSHAFNDTTIPFVDFLPTLKPETMKISEATDNGLFNKMVELNSTNLFTVGHIHNVNWAKAYRGIYLQYARCSGFAAWGKDKNVEPGVTMITIDTNQTALNMYDINVQLYDQIMKD